MTTVEQPMAKALLEASDYIKDVISVDPYELYHDTLQKPLPSKMPKSATRLVNAQIQKNHPDIISVKDGDISLYGILYKGIDDSQTFFHDAYSHSPNVTPEEAARILRSPLTIYTLAGMALQAGHEFDESDFSSHGGKRYAINAAKAAIEPGTLLRPSNTRGCPFAGKEGEINPSGLFAKFSIWAGTLATQTYFNHFHGTDPTEALRK